MVCGSEEWEQKILSEIKSLFKNNVVDIVIKLANMNIIVCKTILTNKNKFDDTMERRKTKIIAKELL